MDRIRRILDGFKNAAGTKTRRAGENPLDETAFLNPDALQVGEKTAIGRLVGMADGLASHRTFAAFITGICHGDCLEYEEHFISV